MSKRVIAALVADVEETLTPSMIMDSIMPFLIAVAGNDEELPNEGRMHPAITVGDLRAVGAFWNVHKIMEEVVLALSAQLAAEVCGPGVIHYIDGPEDMHTLVAASIKAAQPVVLKVRIVLEAAFGPAAIDSAAADKILQQMDGMLAQVVGSLEKANVESAGKSGYVGGPSTLQ